MANSILFLLSVVSLALFLFGMYFRSYVLIYLGSAALMVLGVQFLTEGVLGVMNFLTEGTGVVLIGAGAFVMLKQTLDVAVEEVDALE